MEIIMTIDFPDEPPGATIGHGPEPVRAGAGRPRQARATPGGGRAARARHQTDGAAPRPSPPERGGLGPIRLGGGGRGAGRGGGTQDGRGSGRGRGEISVVARSLKKKKTRNEVSKTTR